MSCPIKKGYSVYTHAGMSICFQQVLLISFVEAIGPYLHTKTVGIAGSQEPDAVVGQAIEELLEEVSLLLLALLLKLSIAAVGCVLQHG